MKTSIILSALITVFVSTSTVFATGVKIPEVKSTNAASALSNKESEAAYLQEIEAYYEENFEASLDDVLNPVKFVVVYDANGQVVLQSESIAHLPLGAELLMNDGDTAYYIQLK